MELLKTHTDFKTCLILSIELAERTRLWDLSGSGAESLWVCSAPETPAADSLFWGQAHAQESSPARIAGFV